MAKPLEITKQSWKKSEGKHILTELYEIREISVFDLPRILILFRWRLSSLTTCGCWRESGRLRTAVDRNGSSNQYILLPLWTHLSQPKLSLSLSYLSPSLVLAPACSCTWNWGQSYPQVEPNTQKETCHCPEVGYLLLIPLSTYSSVFYLHSIFSSRYIADPLLIGGNKIDLRVYVYVASYDPLMIYVFSDGLTRFATCKYAAFPFPFCWT